jgi:hypothetical protein
MKRVILGITLIIISLAEYSITHVISACGDTWQPEAPDTVTDCGALPPGTTGITTFIQTKHWRIFWMDGYERRDAQVTQGGECRLTRYVNYKCMPEFRPGPLIGLLIPLLPGSGISGRANTSPCLNMNRFASHHRLEVTPTITIGTRVKLVAAVA